MTGKHKAVRCAIYTRKSSEEGLEQDFNSLHAQREACVAYIRSQQHEGWRLVPDAFDDGGYSGGTMTRPALARLLDAVKSGVIDVVVVYKVDRLTRSLMDFAQMVALFDEHAVSFVSVTQQFNTTSSMGRLTLNVLLSFAQFEREVTGERIRDKIAASKKKGLWMGGHVPLGYDAVDRALVVNAPEAETVRTLFRLYEEHGCVRRTRMAADRLGLASKSGTPFSRGHLYRILQNPLYIGEIRHGTSTYPGLHDAIVDRQAWEAVQQRLAGNRRARRHGANAREPSLLTGLLFDARGTPFSPSHAVKGGRRYRYYIARPLTDGSEIPGTKARRLPAGEIESGVIDALAGLLQRPPRLLDILALPDPAPARVAAVTKAAGRGAERLRNGVPAEQAALLTAMLERVVIAEDAIRLDMRVRGLRGCLGVEPKHVDDANAIHPLTVPMQLRRRGVETRLVIDGGTMQAPRQVDPTLVRTVVRAHDWWQQLLSGAFQGTADIARAEGLTSSYVARVLKLAFLAPGIIRAILDGTAPAHLTADRLVRYADLPLDWPGQRRFLGFPSA